MANFFEDNEDIRFHLDHLDLAEVIALLEDDFAEADRYEYAPRNTEDARDGYRQVLHMLGEMAAEEIAPLAPEVDEEGARYENGGVTYAGGTARALELLSQADLMGLTLPREYEGLNFPTTIYCMAVEMVARADASLMNVFGLQDIADTIDEFAEEEIKAQYLPRFSVGEVTGAMILTEPDAGSDLQAVQVKAEYDEENDLWRLSGVKRFITNGCADVSLVLARSEPGTMDGRGLSLFLCERDETVQIRRIENKMGIHGSPTCEIQFNETKGILIGRRRMGLIRYVMALMNRARLGVACQALGIAEAAYNEALKYAREREQFRRKIIEFPAVYEMLVNMRTAIQSARALTYHTAVVVDMKKGLERQLAKMEKPSREMKDRLKYYTGLAGVLTPMAKYVASEMANRVAYDAVQVHGGTGFMREFNVERHYRDARITSIYEGTSQLQVVAAIGGVLTRTLDPEFDRFARRPYDPSVRDLVEQVTAARKRLDAVVDAIHERDDRDFTAFHARRIVDIAVDIYISYRLLGDADEDERRQLIARKFVSDAIPRIEMNATYVLSGDTTTIEAHEKILEIS